MEQHPIPRQITSFEFKLIGFLTLKQFIYLVVFIPIGIIMYYIFPVPLLNILVAIACGGVGVAFAFVPINDRPMEVWVRNFYKRLTSPTQYVFHKHNPPIYFLHNLVFLNDPHRVLAHVESQEKLSAYLAKTTTPQSSTKKQSIHNLFNARSQEPIPRHTPAQKSLPITSKTIPTTTVPQVNNTNNTSPVVSQQPKTPFFSGTVKNHKHIPIPGVLIYVKDSTGKTLRLLKTNPHGIFATFNPLSTNEYIFEIKDPKNTYFFDTIKVRVEPINSKPFEFISKEML